LISTEASIITITDLGEDYFFVEAECPEISSLPVPGNFVNIRIADSSGVLLRRPFGIFDIEGKIIKFFFKRIGKGTTWISNRRPGDKLDIIGPLGKGVFNPGDAKRIIVIAGGTGIAPIYYFLKYYRNHPAQKILFYGARSKNKVFFQNELFELTDKCIFVTEDGTLGEMGMVSEELKRYYLTYGPNDNDLIISCGPKAMLKEIVEFAEDEHIPCQVSLESYMGCGSGVCLSCVVPARNYNNAGQSMFRVCSDGPVVDSKIIDKKYFETKE